MIFVTVLLNLKFKEFHVDWNAVDKVYLFSEATSSKLYRAVGNKLGLSKCKINNNASIWCCHRITK